MKIGRLLFGAVTFALLSVSANAAILYAQPSGGSAFFASQFDTTGGSIFATTYDNFTLVSSADITRIDFMGEYDTDPPPPPLVTGFTLSIYSDNSGQPGGLLYTQIVSGNAHETLIASETYSYYIDLTSPFATTGGTSYWVSVVSDLALPVVWGWHSGTGGDSLSYQDVAGSRSQFPNDLAFTLSGDVVATNVPEPITLSLFGIGLAGAVAMRRRKRPA